MGRLVWLWAFACLCGCAVSRQATPPTAGGGEAIAAGARVLLIESDIKFYVITAGGVAEPQPDWTETARTNFVSATRRELAAHGHDLVTTNPDAPDERLISYEKLHQAVAQTIAIWNGRLPAKHGRFDYSLGPGVSFMKERYGADYALFVTYHDARASGGQQAKAIIAGLFGVYGVNVGGQSGYASLVDLTSGDVVWCRFVGVGTGDLREPAGADKTVSVLFEGMHGG